MANGRAASTSARIRLATRSPATGDFNRDGTADVLWFNPTTGETDIWKIANGQWAGSTTIGLHPLGWQIAGIGDFNNDGTERCALVQPDDAQDRNLEESRTANGPAASTSASHPAGYAPVGVGDFNNDGTSDVLWFNPTTRDIDIWQIVNGKWTGSIDDWRHIRPDGRRPASATSTGDGTERRRLVQLRDGQHRHLAGAERPVGAQASISAMHPPRLDARAASATSTTTASATSTLARERRIRAVVVSLRLLIQLS